MREEILDYLEKFDEMTKKRFHDLYELIYESTEVEIDEKLWARLPSFYVDKNYIRLITFKDHININAKAVLPYKEDLKGYKITPKGMLQVFHHQEIPRDVLRKIFKESLQ